MKKFVCNNLVKLDCNWGSSLRLSESGEFVMWCFYFVSYPEQRSLRATFLKTEGEHEYVPFHPSSKTLNYVIGPNRWISAAEGLPRWS